jgi:hypothetical protein
MVGNHCLLETSKMTVRLIMEFHGWKSLSTKNKLNDGNRCDLKQVK